MKHQRISQCASKILGLFQAAIARVSLLTPPRGLAPVPVPVRRRSGPTRWLASSQRTGWLPLLVGCVLLVASPAWAGAPALPAGVPNIFDPAVRAQFQAVGTANLQNNPDLPVLLFVKITGDEPQVLLLGFDARNEKDTWSLTTDPIILIGVFTDATTSRDVFLDTGFVDGGKASGTFAAMDPANASTLAELLKAVPSRGKQSNI